MTAKKAKEKLVVFYIIHNYIKLNSLSKNNNSIRKNHVKAYCDYFTFL